MKTLKIGVIGCGAISHDHIKGCQGHAKAEVVAVADICEKRAKKVSKQYGIPRYYLTAAELIADKDIDAVTVALPNCFHSPVSIAALNAGKHTASDKPFSTNQHDAKKVIAAAKKKRKVFTVPMNWRFFEEGQVARALVERGDLGEVYHAKACVMRRPGIPKIGTWFTHKEEGGGGALYDIGVHFLDLTLYVLDNFEPVSVTGQTYAKFGPRGIGESGWGESDRSDRRFDVDDFGTAFVKFKNGATITLDAAWMLHMASGGRAGVELFGTQGGATISPTKLFKLGKKKGEFQVIEPQNVKLRYPHKNRFHNFIDAVLGTDELATKPEQSLVVQKILDAIYKSSATGKEVRIK